MGNATARRRLFDPASLEARDDAVSFELVDGVLVKRCMGYRSTEAAAWILVLLGNYVITRKLGRVLGADLALRIWPDEPRTVRKPDVAFIANASLPPGFAPGAELTVAPDLVVEVISPNKKAVDLQTKVRAYLAAGVRVVWVAYPETRSIHVHEADGSGVILGPKATVNGGDVLPGFSAPIEALFPNYD